MFTLKFDPSALMRRMMGSGVVTGANVGKKINANLKKTSDVSAQAENMMRKRMMTKKI